MESFPPWSLNVQSPSGSMTSPQPLIERGLENWTQRRVVDPRGPSWRNWSGLGRSSHGLGRSDDLGSPLGLRFGRRGGSGLGHCA